MERVVIDGAEARMKNTDVRFLRLWDAYNGMLTEKRREIANLYFNCDLSLGEIAAEKGVSRQSVSDCLHKCREQLEEIEEKLHHVRKEEETERAYALYRARVEHWANEQKKRHPAWTGELDELLAFADSETERTENGDE